MMQMGIMMIHADVSSRQATRLGYGLRGAPIAELISLADL